MIKRIVFVVAGLLILGALGFVALNSTDTQLDPAAAALIKRFRDHPDPPGNAYYPLIGLQLPGQADPETKGRGFVEKLASMTITQQTAQVEKELGPLLKLPNVPDCNPRVQHCLAVYQANKACITAAIQRHRTLLHGYSYTIQNYHVFYDPGVVVVWDIGLSSAQELYAYQTIHLWAAGQGQRALRRLSQDVSFWRMILGDAPQMTARFMAVAILTDDYGLAGEILRRCAPCRDTKPASELLAPLTTQELDPIKAREGEFVQNVTLMKKAEAERGHKLSLWKSLFYHRNRITNALYSELQDEIRLAKAPPERRAPLTNQLNAKYAGGTTLVSWLGLYVHPESKMLAAVTWAARGDANGNAARALDTYRAQIAKRTLKQHAR